MKIQCNADDPDFFFDEANHFYLYKGSRVPSVTQVMKAASLSKDYGDIDPRVLANAAARGTAVHLAIEQLNAGTLNWGDVHEEILPRLLAYQQFVTDHKWNNVCSERKYYSKKWGYAGGMDEVGVLWRHPEDFTLLDFKTAYSTEMPGWCIQIQAYKNLWNENNPPERQVKHCYILWLNRDGKYELLDANDEESWALFVYGLKILAWKKKHKR